MKLLKNSNLMTPKEEGLMELLWSSEETKTTADISSVLNGKGWNKSTIFNTIHSLLKKNYIKVSGVERSNTQYARQFESAVTREEYAAIVLTEKGFKKSSLANIALAMTGSAHEDDSDNEKLIGELEEIIAQLRG